MDMVAQSARFHPHLGLLDQVLPHRPVDHVREAAIALADHRVGVPQRGGELVLQLGVAVVDGCQALEHFGIVEIARRERLGQALKRITQTRLDARQ
ncbi:hypothetical protein, partial [Metallibacterium sp.]|uniref:hypothetical protein n=1 Tax=Metallibacterium sp. TaxID=2940281 RepID=UPI00260E8BA5